MMKTYVSLAALLIVTACSSPSVKPTTETPATKTANTSEDGEANLTRDEAALRNANISDIAYTFDAHVDGSSDSFKAVSSVQFKLLRDDSVFLDFKNGAHLDSISINDKLETVTYQNHRLLLPAKSLHQGVNKVVTTYSMPYSHDGRGLHRFEDPEDKNIYLYTQFESYDAHWMFPCFDQPDLKATMTMKVTAPKAWQIITTTRETSVKKQGDESLWTFATTPKISTYLFSLHAGPYAKWEEKAGAIPMRLFIRQALKKYVDPKEWFVPTRQGLKFYGDYFNYPYPFKKFDEVVAPDFNAGAMENVAAITFSERYIHRGPATREERERIASVILHEMAHMWFGDLVTMKWWNGLWLNESFATFMSALSQYEATEFKESWETFYRKEKAWAYWEDQLPTTHPIEARIDDVATAFTNFDGITYGKGASVLKVLNSYMGPKDFRNGVREYFKAHAYSNTTLHDFIGSLEKASGTPLQDWSKTWLEDAGLDTVEAVYSCDNGVISKFELLASGPDGKPTPRTHKTDFQAYDAKWEPVGSTGNITYKNGSNGGFKAVVGTPCPSFIDVNSSDNDYVKVKLDARSLDALQKRPMGLKNSFERIRAWLTLEMMVRDGLLKPDVYLQIALVAANEDTNVPSLDRLTETLPEMLWYLRDQGTGRTEWITKFETVLFNRALRAPAGSDLQKAMLMKYVQISESKDARDKLNEILIGSIPMKDLDADRRWEILQHMSALGDPRVSGLLADEKKRDPSENGIQMAMAVEAAAPNAAAKRVWFDALMKDGDVKYARARTAMRHMFPASQEKIRESFANEYYARLPDFASKRNVDLVELFGNTFSPRSCTAAGTTRMKEFAKNHPEFPPTLTRLLRINAQEEERCVKARSL